MGEDKRTDAKHNRAINLGLVDQIETRIVEGGIHRIIQCLESLEDDHLYYRPNDNSNSINTQVLHLNGNVRQWLISTMSDAPDVRIRDEEFDSENRRTKTELISILKNLETDIKAIYSGIEQISIDETQTVQCYTETNLSIIVHVIEHFSYHVGQITYITKMLLDIDTGYYAGQDLTQIN